jgi:hypothetical protein
MAGNVHLLAYPRREWVLVAKTKAINQWMECKDCNLQQVKPIKVSQPEDRRCIHCEGTDLKEISIYSQ